MNGMLLLVYLNVTNRQKINKIIDAERDTYEMRNLPSVLIVYLPPPWVSDSTLPSLGPWKIQHIPPTFSDVLPVTIRRHIHTPISK